jgi:Zn-dependent M28 family amino/carboxypeptidase
LDRAALKRVSALFAITTIAAAQNIEFDTVSRQVVEERLRAFTTRNDTRESTLRKLFEDAGCAGEALAEEPVKGSRTPNLICTQPGSIESTIVVGAHFDLVPIGQGVVDNWSGASLLPSLYQGLSKRPRRHRMVFVGFTGEESGLLGSKAFVKQLGNDASHVKAMVNMDTLGLSETKVWSHAADPNLLNLLRVAAASMNMTITGVNVERIGTTDSESFHARKIPAITLHSLTQETLNVLHSPRDRIGAIHMDEYYGTYRLTLGYLALLDQRLE